MLNFQFESVLSSSTPIVAIESNTADLPEILSKLLEEAKRQSLPLYYWNCGYNNLQKIDRGVGDIEFCQTEIVGVLEVMRSHSLNGLVVLDGLLEETDLQSRRVLDAQLSNIFYQIVASQTSNYVVILGEYIELGDRLRPLIPLLEYPLPDSQLVSDKVREFIDNRRQKFEGRGPLKAGSRGAGRGGASQTGRRGVGREGALFSPHSQLPTPLLKKSSPYSPLPTPPLEKPSASCHLPSAFNKLVKACLGLSSGEIRLILNRASLSCKDTEEMAQYIQDYKISQLRNQGLEFISEPDVPTAGGLDLLSVYLDDVVKLTSPEAKQYKLGMPKGLLLWGPPGTGKTLSAKLAAKKLGCPLLACSWGNLLGAPSSDRALSNILRIADSMGQCILFFDDFDKGFSGWETNADGGVSRRLSQKLLTWMQEHTSDVMVIATANRLGMLPAELQRRFDGGIWFVDLPGLGAMYSIFNLHLAKYFPEQFAANKPSPWTDRQWYRILNDYRGATPAEIGNAVKHCATRIYCSLTEQELHKSKPLTVTIDDLRQMRSQFTLSSIRSSEEIQAIRNQAHFARPAAGPDRSRFASTDQVLFEYKPSEFED